MVPTAGIYPGPTCSAPLDLHTMAVKGGAVVFNGHGKPSSNTTGINLKAWHSRTPGHSGARPLRSSHVVPVGDLSRRSSRTLKGSLPAKHLYLLREQGGIRALAE